MTYVEFHVIAILGVTGQRFQNHPLLLRLRDRQLPALVLGKGLDIAKPLRPFTKSPVIDGNVVELGRSDQPEKLICRVVHS